ncbi:MAG: peptidoglycan DD-metalloendopeptidase family protein [Hahellaceae bacterium]|nr:peptidoglycan DD-metalloendopeptidase family protein [Hahellaceae bacterium]MCP5168824.1 peptidoglycan DD-metalloendopeptidase family protein [Hahellaceae bacterium]
MAALAAFCIALLSNPAMAARKSNESTSPEVSQQQLVEIQKAISNVNSWLNKAQAEKGSLEAELRDIERNVSRTSRDIHKISAQLDKTQERLLSDEARKRDLTKKLLEQERQLKQQINTTYALGNEPAIKALLSTKTPQELGRTLVYYDYLNDARSQEIVRFRETLQALNQTTSRILTENQTLISQKESLFAKRDQLRSQQARRETTVKQLRGSIAGKNKELRKLTQDQERLIQLLAEIEKTISTLKLPHEDQPFAAQRKQLPWPLKGKIGYSFGSSLDESTLKANGILIKAAEGSPVLAPHYGRVMFADWIRGFGLMLIVDHNDGYMTIYGHNKALLKEIGDWVSPGDLIAYAGNSGNLTESGLYFEIRKDGKPLDPIAWLEKHK